MSDIPKLLNNIFHHVVDVLFSKKPIELKEYNPNIYLPTPEVITRYGYDVETHRIRTSDNYLLAVHRIPRGKSESNDERARPVVFLQHGLFCSSADWIVSGPERGLGFLLADRGYDVWMGNSRGNAYSKYHSSLNPESADFWDFSWDQMAENDLPAVIDYILNKTQQQQLTYVGHSMGTTMFFAFMSTHPEYRDKVKLMVALAPVAYLSNMSRPLRDLAKAVYEYPSLMSLFGKTTFLPEGKILISMIQRFCGHGRINKVISAAILSALAGYCREHIDDDIKPVILSHALSGTSTRTVKHYLQNANSGQFSKYDFGEEKNRIVYQQTSPPTYDLEQVSVPVVAFFSENDYFVSSTDIEVLLQKLPNVVKQYRVDFSCFNHFDFLYARDAPNLVYEHLMRVLQDFNPINQY